MTLKNASGSKCCSTSLLPSLATCPPLFSADVGTSNGGTRGRDEWACPSTSFDCSCSDGLLASNTTQLLLTARE